MIRRTATFLFVVCVVLAAAWPLLSGQRFAFRDVSHFYLPLYDYVAHRTASEWLPLWNPLDHTGMPLVGESTTAVLYPVRYAIFSLPILPEYALNAYLIVHLLLASAASAWLARRIGCGGIGVVIAAIVYPLSGSVFSLCCNPPFLVGAAWLPFALGALSDHQFAGQRTIGQRTIGQRKRLFRSTALLAFTLTMMVLGGDPQTALNSVLVIVAGILIDAFRKRKRPANQSRLSRCESSAPQPSNESKEKLAVHSATKHTDSIANSSSNRSLLVSLLACGFACLLALGLSSVQVAASLDWSRQSDRVADSSHQSEVYDFSMPPWHLAEILTPRPFGYPFPANQRIAKLIPGEGRMWTPSIYAGLIVGFALLCRLCRPHGYLTEPWLALSIISLLICFGHFGLVWCLQQIPGLLEDSHSAIGGFYWMLCKLVPGYSSFRYPVKWLPMFALASSMVAAQWSTSDPTPFERRLVTVLGIVLIACIGVSHWVSISLPVSNDADRLTIPIDEYWGPLDIVGGCQVIRSSCFVSLLALICLYWLRQNSLLHNGGFARRWIPACWIAFVAVDCGANASRVLPTVGITKERQLANQAGPPPIRASRTLRTQAGMWPNRWRASHSPDRVIEVAASERIAWFGRWHLAERRAVFNSMVSIRSLSYAKFWEECFKITMANSPDQRRRFFESIRQWLAIDAVSFVDETRVTAASGNSLVYVDRRLTDKVQPVRVVADWKAEATMASILNGIAISGEVALPHVPFPSPTSVGNSNPTCVVDDQEQILVQCQTTCVLERCIYQDGNWTASLTPVDGSRDPVDVPVVRSSHLNQAIQIPAGTWSVRFNYAPWWRTPTLALTFVSALLLLFLACFGRTSPPCAQSQMK